MLRRRVKWSFSSSSRVEKEAANEGEEKDGWVETA